MATVVIVDDEDRIRAVVAELLERADYKVIPFPNAEPVLTAINFDHIDLIIMDLAMPMRGEQAIHSLRSSGVTVPIIVLSGVLQDGDELSLKALGADRILPKP